MALSIEYMGIITLKKRKENKLSKISKKIIWKEKSRAKKSPRGRGLFKKLI